MEKEAFFLGPWGWIAGFVAATLLGALDFGCQILLAKMSVNIFQGGTNMEISFLAEGHTTTPLTAETLQF